MLEHYELKEIEYNKSIGGCYDTKVFEIVNYDGDEEKLASDIKKYNDNCAFWLSLGKGNIINGKQTLKLIIDHLD